MPQTAGKTGRNDPCPCGSGKKYKHCCGRAAAGAARGEVLSVPQAMQSADAMLRAGLHAEAVAAYLRILRVQPGNANALSNLGIALHEQHRFEEAVARYREAIRLEPGFARAYNNLGNSLMALRRYEDAISSFQAAIRIDPQIPEGHTNLGLARQNEGKLEEAVQCHERAIRLQPQFALAHTNLGLALQAQGRVDAAIASHRQALQLQPTDATAWCNLGLALQDQGSLEEATECMRQALARRPEQAELHYNLHSLLLSQGGDLQAAIGCIREAARIAPGNATFSLFLGVLLDCAGDTEAAVHLALAEKGDPQNRARADAWRYLKGASQPLPRVTGSSADAFKIGIDAARLDGLVLEFGVRFGTSIRQIAALAGQQVHGFDSFVGLPEDWHREGKGAYSTGGAVPTVPDNVQLHAGWFEDTLPAFLREHQAPARFINIDCDTYGSTATVLGQLAPRIAPGSVLVFDEYIGNEQWREDEFKAFQEAATRHHWRYRYLCFSFYTKQVAVLIQ